MVLERFCERSISFFQGGRQRLVDPTDSLRPARVSMSTWTLRWL